MPATPPAPRVVAILVVHDGEEWVATAVRTLRAQQYPSLDVVVVDNASTDRSVEVVSGRVDDDRIIRLERNGGFGRAVAAGLRHEVIAGAEYVLLVHDDLVLVPDAVARLVAVAEADPSVGIVGPKLREWSEEHLLQEVGMTADRYGRPESGIDTPELDQGQRDGRRDVLYVSTAGMMLRAEVLRGLGGFDARFPAFRDDLDLCWRAWLSGRRVAVVPDAIGYHLAASAGGLRAPYDEEPAELRYLAERHTFATLLKNYGALRVCTRVPIALVLALLKVLGFISTRRFADAWAVVRAMAWNLGQLPATLRRRRIIQRRRRARDADLAGLFAPGLPRLRTYAEAVAEWVAGGTTRALVDDVPVDEIGIDPLAGRPLRRFVRDHPTPLVALPLGGAYLLGVAHLLGAGQIVGGEVLPWPDSPLGFLQAYTSSWAGEPLASASFPSPQQALLGIVSVLGFGSAWVAQRLVVLGLVPLAWLLALRAGRLVTQRRWPRAIGATVYALAPIHLAALAEGRLGALVVGALLPGLVLVAIRTADPRTPPGSAWRAAALLGLGLAACASVAPRTSVGLLAGVAVALLVAALRAVRRGPASFGATADDAPDEPVWRSGRVQPLARLLVAALGAAGILAPWLLDVLREGGLPAPVPTVEAVPLWRAVLLVPTVLGGLPGGAAVAAVVPGAVLVAAVLVGLRARPRVVAGLVALVALSGVGAWALDRYAAGAVWGPVALLPGTLALAVLATVIARWFLQGLQSYDFGLRQMGTALAGAALVVGIVGGLWRTAVHPLPGLLLDPELVPAFVSSELEAAGPYRVLLLDRRDDGVVAWDVVRERGPSMVDAGGTPPRALERAFGEAVRTVVAGGDVRAGGRLGLLNVRYVVLAEPDPELATALVQQPALEPLPSGAGLTYRVLSWLPRAAVLPPDVGERLLGSGDPGTAGGLEALAFRRVRAGELRSPPGSPSTGLLVVSEASSDLWQATANGRELERVDLGPVNAFRVDDAGEDPRYVAEAAGGVRRRLVVTGQLLLVLGLASLALRPPGFTQRQVRREEARRLPDELSPLTLTGPLPVLPPPAAPPARTGPAGARSERGEGCP